MLEHFAKKGSKSMFSNYRPVSLTFIVCKLLESLIRDVVLCFLAELGIIFEDDFKFDEHMSKIINNANSKLVIIKNTFHELTKYNFIILYKACVRPILEYCCTTWAPYFIKDHKEIEKVQKRATKLVKSISHLPYGERLKKLSLTTLYYRRQRADVLQVFRIIKGIDKLDIGFS